MEALHQEKRREKKHTLLFVLLLAAAILALGWSGAIYWRIRADDAREKLTAERFRAYASVPAEEKRAADEAQEEPRKEEKRVFSSDSPLPVVLPEPSRENAAEKAVQSGADSAKIPDEAARVDFDAVIREAPDTKSWIRIPGTKIHYPVVQASDNDFYLTHGPDGVLSRSGAIFISCENADDFSDPNTILYGHRMNSGTMFADLHKFLDRSFLQQNPDVFLTQPDGTVLRYEVFCVRTVHAASGDEAYRTSFAGEEDFRAWQTRKRSGVEATRPEVRSAEEKYLTLSTCLEGHGEKRLIVEARLAGRHETQNLNSNE